MVKICSGFHGLRGSLIICRKYDEKVVEEKNETMSAQENDSSEDEERENFT